MLLLHASYNFNEDLIAMCVCSYRRRQRSWLRSKLSSEYHFPNKEALCAHVLFEFVCQDV